MHDSGCHAPTWVHVSVVRSRVCARACMSVRPYMFWLQTLLNFVHSSLGAPPRNPNNIFRHCAFQTLGQGPHPAHGWNRGRGWSQRLQRVHGRYNYHSTMRFPRVPSIPHLLCIPSIPRIGKVRQWMGPGFLSVRSPSVHLLVVLP